MPALSDDTLDPADFKDVAKLKQALVNRLIYTIGKDPVETQPRDWFFALAYVVRDGLTQRWLDTLRTHYLQDVKRVYYLSMEFLIGRALVNSLVNMGLLDTFRQVLEDVGLNFEEVCEIEEEAALGNGGLGRLAACFMDSLATLQLPGFGFGIRYEYGMFSQSIERGWQVERPDNWLRYGNPWEFPRPEVLYRVQFRGRVVEYRDPQGQPRFQWLDTEEVMAMAYDTPIPGYGGATVNNLRLWSAKATRDFELKYFNEGNYIRAVEEKNGSENLSKVLYPDDTTAMGRELRLKQEYFFVSASLQDILRKFNSDHRRFEDLPDEVAIQLNDTHPAIAIPELMRLLIDEHGVVWETAWDVTVRTFSYTNHTLLPEALETWPVRLFETLLPRHLQIIYEINFRFLREVSHRYPGDMDLTRRVSLIDEDSERRVRMAYLAIVGSHKVNGVARLHSQLMQATIFRDFARLFPDRFINITNGVTPRRWLNQSNPGLAGLITRAIGPGWVSDLDRLKALEPLADDPAFLDQFRAIKAENKVRLAQSVWARQGVELLPDALFDVQIKRIHEYKRQLLNLLHVVTRYNRLRADPTLAAPPRCVILGGKAAPGYYMAKLIIKLVNDIAEVVNNDPAVKGRLQVVYVPNYNVSRAMELIPAAELSEQISTAGTEASGTSNMKLSLNGALTVGTLDGANIEICEEVGEDNIFIFGHTADELDELRRRGYNPWDYYHANAELRQALDMIESGYFSPDEQGRFRPLVDALLTGGDRYALIADYGAYIACQDEVDRLYLQPTEWARKAVLNVARSGKFSSDRTIREYTDLIWDVKPAQPG
ncbi:glycogen/starch/alpha-glucan phosphorylase [Methylococcus sp. EFPC2]|uniref:glycogen/starch/alpha-glucan phosphorylase n=1 Tax=Methylococcus sp. EFPC2 TaxID=2812648 RepID=UPI0019675152|nr:glycogen/starch/alpha-glucan phosphorylase [Methylococcus sp. EFPC2]QSA98837.1 glycogen/starch/alpha-glucan phosphorylase [Methylococcus sp. EFPC2]